MIKQYPKNYHLFLTRNKEQAMSLKQKHFEAALAADLSYCSFQAAWTLVCLKTNKLFFPKDIICNFINPELANLLSLAIKGNILIANTEDTDEWWITFVAPDGKDVDIIFYSPGV